MSDQVKKVAPLIWSEIQKANTILFHCHPGPDPDSVGGVLAMKHLLSKLGKKITIIAGDSELPSGISHLPGFADIEAKNWFQIDPTKYDLFISQDSSDLSQISKLGEIKFPTNMRVVVIDHHGTSVGYGHVNFIEPAYPAVCQMVFELAQEWKLEINKDAAACIFLGMYTDTGGFKYPNTSPDTFRAAASLAEINPQFYKVVFDMENSRTPQQIKYIGLSLTSIEVYFGGRIAISAVSYEQLRKNGIQKRNTEKVEISEMLKSVKGWEVGIRFTEADPGKVTLSMRTRDAEKYDVSKIAIATGFGGGHKEAAGATISKPFDQAKKHLLESIQKAYPDLGQP